MQKPFCFFQDSKYLEKRVEGRLVKLLRKIYPEELEKDEDYLDQVGITDNPKLTLVCGPIVLKGNKRREDAKNDVREDSLKDTILDLSFFPGSLGLSAESIKKLHIQDLPARTILLIENLTTYQEVLQVLDLLPPPMLVIYIGGFPHKTTQKLLGKIAGYLAENPETNIYVYHWGDIDYGGIRIFEYLRRNFFPKLKPFRMDVDTYLKYYNTGLQFGEDQALKLKACLDDPSFADWHPLLKELIHYRKRVEQESIRISRISLT